jgi:DNA-binding winged helix-turn-helix (wHTH) protein/tetratricopeptide (TPR) repeat protein
VTDRPSCTYKFDDFVIDTGKRTLSRAGSRLPLSSKAFDTLLYLVQNHGEIVDKADLMSAVWPDTVVEENNLNQSISILRRVLGESRGENRFIATVPGRGYCFTADVRPATPPSSSEEPTRHITIGVLPFDNLTGSSERDYLADGLTEESIATLGQMDPGHLSVIGRTTAIVAKRSGKSLAEIGRELAAAYLIESSLRGEANLLRITTRLIRVRDQLQIWSATYDREPTSLLAFQRELSVAIAKQVLLRLAPERVDALAHRQTQDPAAYDLYLRGRYHWNQFAPLATRRATEFFARATELDPNYALAWSGLADALISSPVSGDLPPTAILSKARDAAQNAVRSDPSLAESQTSLGFFDFWFGWNWRAAIAAFETAIATDPGYVFAHRTLGIVLSHAGLQDRAAASIRRARELDPLNVMNRALSAQVAFAARDLSAATRYAREAITLDPEFWIGHFQLAQALAASCDPAAFDALNQASRFSNGNSKALSLRAWLLATQGHTSEARSMLGAIESAGRDRFIPPYAVALVHAGLGDTDAALDALDRSYDCHDVHLAFLPIDSKWDPLRDHPRFQRLLSRCNFMSDVEFGGRAKASSTE